MKKTLVEKRFTVIQIIPLLLLVGATLGRANPYPDPRAVPKDFDFNVAKKGFVPASLTASEVAANARTIIRVDVDWQPEGERYSVSAVGTEQSGTDALIANARRLDPHGSYRGTLIDRQTGETLFYSSVGTGQEFRKLNRGITFRFPVPGAPVNFALTVEHPQSGVMEEVLNVPIETMNSADSDGRALSDLMEKGALEVFNIKMPSTPTKVVLNIYAEGYSADRKTQFIQRAEYLANALKKNNFPGWEYFEINGVFAPSNLALGAAEDLGPEVPVRDSFLGLYFPYWHKFGRWYHVIYPTSEKKFRDSVGLVPYDYALALVDNSDYWGVGNFKQHTAIPANSTSFTYLLLHEIGHFFGLNEEYSAGGPTELRFAPDIKEPWSQNLTYATERGALKWYEHVLPETPVPTDSSVWHGRRNGPWGAYRGGYASSDPHHRHKIPGLSCIMNNDDQFCPICSAAITHRVLFDMGN
jgi:hypothetical protein